MSELLICFPHQIPIVSIIYFSGKAPIFQYAYCFSNTIVANLYFLCFIKNIWKLISIFLEQGLNSISNLGSSFFCLIFFFSDPKFSLNISR